MPLEIGWREIALRLGLTFGAAFMIGLNRGLKQEAAGLRTTMLVCLAASVSMIQVNLLLGMQGKTPSSFAVMDLMRLPLGILTGMGFIGAGAIIKRGNMVLGVTTAASLWFTTVIGLCFGGGQIGLGLASLAIAMFVLTVLKWFEARSRIEHRAILFVSGSPDEISQERIEKIIRKGRAEVVGCSMSYRRSECLRTYEFVVGWRAPENNPETPAFIEAFAREDSLRELRWIPDTVSGRVSGNNLE
jgi:putative Mg2+ transporter-C (MgtC) family protein